MVSKEGAIMIRRLPRNVFATLALTACLCSCGLMGSTKIGDIVSKPRDFADKRITVSGEVTEVFSFIVLRYFVIKDDTGEITVITGKPLPEKGEKIKVTGVVKETFSLGTRALLVIVEDSAATKGG
jgi:hypothetical protein